MRSARSLNDSLRILALRESNIADLAPLSALKLLTEVDLKGTVVTDATPLLGLTNLTCLTIDSLRSARDLHQLSGMGSLRTLKIGIGGAVDLAGLAAMKNLTVMVELGTTVRGEHVLDPTVTVRKFESI
jgi:internalin A